MFCPVSVLTLEKSRAVAAAGESDNDDDHIGGPWPVEALPGADADRRRTLAVGRASGSIASHQLAHTLRHR